MTHESSADEHHLARLGTQLNDLARLMRPDPSSPVDPHRLVHVARAAVPHSDFAALTVVRRHRPPITVAGTGDLPATVDRLQWQLAEGPLLDAPAEYAAMLAPDLRTDPRWPGFGPRCAELTGVGGLLSLRLALGGGDHAALTFLSRAPGALRAADVATGSLFTPFAGMAAHRELHDRDVENLRAALGASRRIGTAVGILMSRELVTADEAFDILRRASQRLNRKLRDIATEVELTGALPDEEDPRPVATLD